MENVILNSSQTQIKIVDFGLSNVWSRDHPLRTHCGSPEYAAPELFIAGKEYGPEVDLWSLGIIFYGMVVGQLPFVGGRKNQLSSQERRKRLVAQINKGLGPTQRQAVAPLSAEFKTLLNKLLTADPTKRISSKDLLSHPWITEKGRKIVQKHPFKELDNVMHTRIIKQLSDLFQVDKDTMAAEIFKNPYGRLGGMYNVLTFKYLSEHFHSDQIAPIALRGRIDTSSAKPCNRPKSASVPKSQHTLYNQCIVLLNKVSREQFETRAKSAHPTLTLSKNVTKLSRTKIDQTQSKLQTKPTYSKTNSIVINRKIAENFATPVAVRKTISSKIQIMDNKQSAMSNIKRPNTTGTTRTAIKSSKRNCVSANIATNWKSKSRELQTPQCFNFAAMGDGLVPKKGPSNVVLRKPRPKDRLVNEPIARSIAGYLIRNVPDYMFNRIAK